VRQTPGLKPFEANVHERDYVVVNIHAGPGGHHRKTPPQSSDCPAHETAGGADGPYAVGSVQASGERTSGRIERPEARPPRVGGGLAPATRAATAAAPSAPASGVCGPVRDQATAAPRLEGPLVHDLDGSGGNGRSRARSRKAELLLDVMAGNFPATVTPSRR